MGMCLHVSVCLLCFRLCVCVCVCVYACVLKRLIHACGDSVWREEGERLGMCTMQVEVVSDCEWQLCVIAGCVV